MTRALGTRLNEPPAWPRILNCRHPDQPILSGAGRRPAQYIPATQAPSGRRTFEAPMQAVTVTQCAVLAGGLGTRLGSLTEAEPKPLLSRGGRPFLAWLLREF